MEFWDAADSSVSPADQQMLTAYFYNKLKEDLQKDFTIVDQPGPGVMVLRVALTSAEGATPGLRSISVVIPQARILNGIQSLATGSYAFVGGAQAEIKVTDGQTGQLLAASSDKREGGMSITTAAQWKWGDAENVMDYWAQKIAERAHQLQTTGALTPSSWPDYFGGAEMSEKNRLAFRLFLNIIEIWLGSRTSRLIGRTRFNKDRMLISSKSGFLGAIVFALLLSVFFSAPSASAQTDMFIYPAKGQSQALQDKGPIPNAALLARRVQQTGYDPSRPPPPTAQQPQQNQPSQPHVLKGAGRGAALGAVGGAITGDAGKGAAAGAAMGGIVGGFRRRDERMRQADQRADAAAAPSPARNNYMRAMAACLQGRGYTVN